MLPVVDKLAEMALAWVSPNYQCSSRCGSLAQIKDNVKSVNDDIQY